MTVSRRPVALALALVVTVACEAALVSIPHLHVTQGVAVAVVAAAAWALVVSDRNLEAHPLWAVSAIALAFGIALAMPPRGSHDLWSYVMYGRTLSVHHASPYVHAPAAYPSDPFLARVASGWRSTKSVYGPLFTGLSAVFTKVAAGSALRARLAFQGFAALGIVAALVIVWREVKSVRAIAFLGLHPAIVTAIVNGGHNDGAVGLAVLAAVVLVVKKRPVAAGVVVGLGALVKASTGFGIVGIAVWLFARNRRDAGRFAAAAALTTIAGYLPAGTAALGSLAGAANRTSRASVWSPLSRLVGPVSGPALLVVAILAAVGAWRYRASARPTLTALSGAVAYLVAGAYVLPWYSAWALPSAALTRRSALAWLVAAHGAFLVAAYEVPRSVTPGTAGAVARGVVLGVASAAFLAALVVVITRAGRSERDEHGPDISEAEPGPAISRRFARVAG